MKDNLSILNIFLCIIIVMVISTACNGNQNQSAEGNENLNISPISVSKPIHQSVANKTEEKIITKKEISKVKAVNTDKDLLVAIKVDNFNRFRLKKIEKSVTTEVEKLYPDYKVFVSTDKKMYWELEKLEKKLQKGNTDMKSLKKDIKKIKNLMKEQT